MSRLESASIVLPSFTFVAGLIAVWGVNNAGEGIVWWLPAGALSVMVWLPTVGVFLAVLDLVLKDIRRRRGYAVSAARFGSAGLLVALLAWIPASSLALMAVHDYRAMQASVETAQTHMLTIAALHYAAHHHGHLRKARRWCDDLLPYIRDRRTFRSPSARRLRCAYAFNSALSDVRVNSIVDPEPVVLIFKSDRGWNAAGGPELLPNVPRGYSDIYGFADGHTKPILRTPASMPGATVVWEPTVRGHARKSPER